VHSNKILPGSDDVTVDLGVKGGAGCPAFATTKWKTPAVAGHFCLQVSFSWGDDSNPYNNLGQENVLVGISHSPVTFQFQLRNDKRLPSNFALRPMLMRYPLFLIAAIVETRLAAPAWAQ